MNDYGARLVQGIFDLFIVRKVGAAIAGVMLLAGVASAQESSIIVEAHSGKILAASNPEQRRPVASLTKIATALVVLDWAEVSQTDLATMVQVPQSAAALAAANPMGLVPGDRISLRDALYSALMGSDNVAALALANHVGQSLLQVRGQSGDPERTFVMEMNQLARALGMRSTRFANPHGLDLPRQSGYSTAADMARLSIYAMRKPALAFFVRQEERRVTFQTAAGSKSFRVVNTNTLLKDKSIRGIKTGTTAAAGECLATCAERDPIVRDLPGGQKSITPRRLIVVVLGSPDRFGRTRGFINHGWGLFDQWVAAGSPTQDVARDFLSVPNPR